MVPILFKLGGPNLNYAGTGRRRGGVPPNLCGTFPLPRAGVTITGVSRDSAGAALAGCTCTLFKVTQSPVQGTGKGDVVYDQRAQTVSDGSGNYSFVVGFDGPYRVTFDLNGAPIRAGITLDTLSGV